MTLENMLRKKLADAPAGTAEVVINEPGWTVALRPEAHDTLGCALHQVSVQRDPQSSHGDPRAWGERLSRTATGLLEPLKLLEVDAGQNVAILRSAAPRPLDNALEYYEVHLQGSHRADVRRFRGFHEAGQKRMPVPFTVTYEALAKLIGDITADR
jgi:hypothetical protein